MNPPMPWSRCAPFPNDSGRSDEKRAEGVAAVDAADGLAEDLGDRELRDLPAAEGGLAQRNGVGADDFLDDGGLDALHGRSGQDGMDRVGDDAPRARFVQGFGSQREGAGGVDHVVEQDGSLSPDIADDLHDFRDVGLWAPLVDDGEGRAQALGEGAGAFHAARVRADDDDVIRAGAVLALHVLEKNGGGVQVIRGHVEETLDLPRVQIHGEEAVGAGGGDQVRHQPGGEGGAGRDLPGMRGLLRRAASAGLPERARGHPLAAAADVDGVPRANSRSYSARITFSIRSRVSLLSGCAMSLKVPSFRRFAGMATKSPVLPLMTLRSRTTKQLSSVIVT